tara:strand:- start:4364 stop:5383 length:1020 start_codon:yes stop_codon:yes gene_type:complete
MYTLTKNLYAKDEVVLSLIICLLEKNDLQQCYFWANEINDSGYDVNELLWKIYYDYYFENNPKFEIYMRNTKGYITIVRNLYRFPTSDNVFMLRQYALLYNKPETYLGRTPTWTEKYTNKHFVRAISKNDLKNVANHIYNSNNCEQLFGDVVKYFEGTDDVYNYLKECKYNDSKHFLLAIVIQLLNDSLNLHNTNKIIVPKKNFVLEKSKPYNVLKNTRKYSIKTNIGCFNLERNNIKSVVETLRLHWEYYAYICPFWNEKFKKFYGTKCTKTEKVNFPNDDSIEDFYNNYGYEPDEQSLLIQQQSTLCIPELSWLNWYYDIFNKEPEFVYDKDFKFNY